MLWFDDLLTGESCNQVSAPLPNGIWAAAVLLFPGRKYAGEIGCVFMALDEKIQNMLKQYGDLLRIQFSEDREKEIQSQIVTVKAQLEALGVNPDDVVIRK